MRYQDIVGAEDIVGADDIGAGDPSNGPRAVFRSENKARQYPLGFPTTVFTTLQTANVQTTTQVLFRGRRLVVPSDIASSFQLNDLKVGKNSQLPSTGPVPCRVFSERAVGVDLSLDTAQISQTITLNLTNNSGASVTFNAAMLGDSME